MTPEPRYNQDRDEPNAPEVLRRCDDTLSADCTDDGHYEVWDHTHLIRLCLHCQRAFDNRQTNADPRFHSVEGGVPYHEQQVRR